jgi:hypothetical protein
MGQICKNSWVNVPCSCHNESAAAGSTAWVEFAAAIVSYTRENNGLWCQNIGRAAFPMAGRRVADFDGWQRTFPRVIARRRAIFAFRMAYGLICVPSGIGRMRAPLMMPSAIYYPVSCSLPSNGEAFRKSCSK